METTLLAVFIISVPGLLSATCSSPSSYNSNPAAYAKSGMSNRFEPKGGNGLREGTPAQEGLSWAEDYTPSRRSSPPERCENGWCAEDGSCSCNPCWSGPTCQEYVDRFSPRFLAEEPFVIVDSSSVSSLPFPPVPLVDSSEGASPPPLEAAVPAPSSSSSQSSGAATVPLAANSSLPSSRPHHSGGLEESLVEPANSLDPNLSREEEEEEAKVSIGTPRSSPLFRIEAADDDLGLTCELGQVGPAATCPCATPRYKVMWASTEFPDDRSLASTNHPEETEYYRPSQESSFYNSSRETNLSRFPSSSTRAERSAPCPNRWAKNCRTLNSIMFVADEETGDVFLQNGYNLLPGKYYFITLQVSALHVNSSGYNPWREQIVATLYVKSSSQSDSPLTLSQNVAGSGEQGDDYDVKAVNTPPSSLSSSSEVVESVEMRESDDSGGVGSSLEEDGASSSASHSESGRRREEISVRRSSSSQLFNYLPLEDNELPSSSSLSAPSRKEKMSKTKTSSTSVSNHDDDDDSDSDTSTSAWEPRSQVDGDRGLRRTDRLRLSSRGDVINSRRISHKMTNPKNKLPYALRADRPHFKYPVNSPALDFVDSGDSAYETLITSRGYSSERKKREVPDKSQFKMFITSLDPYGANNTLPLGSITKLNLQIQLASISAQTDFTLEIQSSLAKKKKIKFVILSAYVISIGSDISFDKGTTNLAPLMMPWRNSTVYDSVIWKWNHVKCEKHSGGLLSSSTGKDRWNNEISIEFEVMAINPEDPGSVVVNRWLSSPWQHHDKSKSPLDSSSQSRHRLLPGEVSDGESKRLSNFPSESAGKEADEVLVPIMAYITLLAHEPDDDDDETGREHHSWGPRGGNGLETSDDEDGHRTSNHPGDDNDYVEKGAQHTTRITARLLIPVNFTQSSDERRNTTSEHNKPLPASSQLGKELSGSVPKKGFRGVKIGGGADGVDIQLEGPTEIPQGGWVSYTMKVYLNHSSQFQLRLEPVQGNEIEYQDTVSVGDIRVVSIGKHFSSCTKIPKKRAFRVTCRKLNGRKGDYCTVESPLMRYCPWVTNQLGKVRKPGDDPNLSGSGEVSSNPGKSESEEKWSIQRAGGKLRNKMEGTENMLQFEGIIYGFPGSAPGSQFVLRAHVHVDNVADSLSPEVQLEKKSSMEEEASISGKIIHRKQKILSRGPLSVGDSSSVDFPDGKIPVMREFPAYHYRKRRSIFFDQRLSGSRKRRRSITNSTKSWTNPTPQKKNALFSISDKGDWGKLGGMEGQTGTSAKSISPYVHLVKRNRHRRSAAGGSNLGNPSTPNLHRHRFSTWENFVKSSSAIHSNRARKSKRHSPWAHLL